ncbi:MAG: acetyl/propionyl/methylcrotonyl-CoA carboxylase subunit alpha [Gemmatimonadales bacterium]
MFSKVLIANRGEIALRVIRACRELGIASVAVYSDADARAPHVREADEAVRIGPPPSAESYLAGDRIIAAAKETGAQAIHPGYGFLSEREWFARAVRDAGLVFIGPPAEAIAAMGSKTAARQLATRSNVPVVPGTTEALRDADEARATAARFGYPVLLKAAAGGGGKGMRVVREDREMQPSLDSARREAKNAFGDDAVYVEKYIVGPRHVEIQVLGDQHGTMLSLNERECSVQRRHQKMIEEAPSGAVTPELRRAMGETAVRAARAAGYVNAGTCEFLLDRDGAFYFLEMNTRLQVEHPVTELVTGIDIVQWQIRVAAGERLPFKQEEIVPRGWAMECRITSEDPANGFLPSTGRIGYLHVPAGPGVRWDGGIEVGSEVGLYYDPMLAKLIVHAPTREAAVDRMHRALLELTIDGVESSRDFHLRVMEDAEFRAGAIEIQWLERRLDSLVHARPPAELTRTAAVVAALIADRDRHAPQRIGAGQAAGATPAAAGQEAWLRGARQEGLR